MSTNPSTDELEPRFDYPVGTVVSVALRSPNGSRSYREGPVVRSTATSTTIAARSARWAGTREVTFTRDQWEDGTATPLGPDEDLPECQTISRAGVRPAATEDQHPRVTGRVRVRDRWRPAYVTDGAMFVSPSETSPWRLARTPEAETWQARIDSEQHTVGRIWDDAYYRVSVTA